MNTLSIRQITQLTLLAAMLTAGFSVAAQTVPTPPAPPVATIGPLAEIQPPPSAYRFPDGEVLHFQAEWRIWKAGDASMKIESSGDNQHVTASADASGIIGLLYHVLDRFDSTFDRRTFCSERIFKHVEEGLHKRETTIRFDQAGRKAVLDERSLRTNATKHEERETPGCVTDVLSGIYYMRSLPLLVGRTYYFPVNDGNNTVTVKATVEGRDVVSTDAGSFRTVRVQPSSDSGVLKARGKMWIWYTDDANHFPVQMRARLFWGTLMLKLIRVENAAPK